MAQGGLSVAMVLNYLQVYGAHAPLGTNLYSKLMNDSVALEDGFTLATHDLGALLATVILASVLINELTAFRATRNVLINAGEIDPKALLAPEDMYASTAPVLTAEEPPAAPPPHRPTDPHT